MVEQPAVPSRRWTVGDLARASGLTVRTLHHYDKIGLVSPSERTGAGHRRYLADDVRRLYRVRALQQLGLSLEEITDALRTVADDPAALRALLVTQLADLAARQTQIETVRGQVERVVAQLDAGAPDPEQLLTALELTVPLVDARRHLSKEQLAALTRRSAQLGAARVDALRTEWLELVRQLRDCLRAGLAPDEPRVLALATRWAQIAEPFADGVPPATRAAATDLWHDKQAAIDQGLADRVDWLQPGDLVAVVAYVRRARGEQGAPS